PVVDEGARAALERLSDYMGQRDRFSVGIRTSVNMNFQGRDVEMESKYALSVAKPDRLALRLEEGDGLTYVSTGEKAYSHLPMLDIYVVKDAPESLEAILDTDEAAMFESNTATSAFLSLLLDPEADRALIDRAERVSYVGLEKDDAGELHHVRLEMGKSEFGEPQPDLDLWIREGAEPLLHRIKPDVSDLIAEMMAGQDITVEMSIDYSDWNTDPAFDEATFAFEPPAGAREVESFEQAFADAAAEMQGGEAGPHPLLGKAAPSFALEDLDGRTVDLSKHLGQNVVVLDFWATWCPPCREGLPVVTKVTQRFKNQGVVFYGVDLQENADTVREFLKTQNLDFPVLLDVDAEAAELYGVTAIPQTVLIGKDGSVQAVHVGLLPDLELELS